MAGTATTVRFTSRQKFCHDKHAFVVTKHLFFFSKSILVATKLLSLQAYFSRDKHMYQTDMLHVVTHKLGSCRKYNFCHDWQTCLSLQNTSFCRNKKFVRFLSTKLCQRQITSFVVTKWLSQQIYVCPDKTFVATKTFASFCRDKMRFVATNMFVATEIILSRQNTSMFVACGSSRQWY